MWLGEAWDQHSLGTTSTTAGGAQVLGLFFGTVV